MCQLPAETCQAKGAFSLSLSTSFSLPFTLSLSFSLTFTPLSQVQILNGDPRTQAQIYYRVSLSPLSPIYSADLRQEMEEIDENEEVKRNLAMQFNERPQKRACKEK